MRKSNAQLLRRCVAVAKPYWTSESSAGAIALLALLLLLVCGVNAMNVTVSYVASKFMTALTTKNVSGFYGTLWLYGSIFAVGTPIVVMYFYVQDKLSLHWRDWLTQRFLKNYFESEAYYHVNNGGRVDNPDERIAQDVREFTKYAVGLFLTVVGSVITLCSFMAILWSISSLLVLIVVAYATFGTVVTLWLGRRLIGLNFDQLRVEADLRYQLIHVRNHREAIAFYRGHRTELQHVMARLRDVVRNFSLVIGWQRNLGFVKTSYDYLIVLIPSVVIAPLYFRGEIDFGTITRADMAFAQILVALSVVVAQFRTFSEFLAQVDRLGELQEALAQTKQEEKEKEVVGGAGENVGFSNVTLTTPDGSHTLVKDLHVLVQPGTGLLIMGPSGCGKSSLLRVLAGLWTNASGEVWRPPQEETMFLPQRPYMVRGSLREQLVYPTEPPVAALRWTDGELAEALNNVGLPNLLGRVAGLEAHLNWEDILSLGEQQRLAFARLLLHKPRYVVLDEATSALDGNNEARLYALMQASGATYVSVGHRTSLRAYHGQVLELNGDGSWAIL